MQWSYDSYHGVISSYGFYDVYNEDHYNYSILQDIREFMPEYRNTNQKILESLRFIREHVEQEKFNQELVNFMHEQKKINLMILEQLQDIRRHLEERNEGIDEQSGSSTFTDTFDDEEGDEALRDDIRYHKPCMPAESQPQPNLECRHLGLQIDDTPMPHSSDICPDSDMNLEDKEVMTSPELLYDLKPMSHRLEELDGDLTFTPSKLDGFGAGNLSIISSQSSFPFDQQMSTARYL